MQGGCILAANHASHLDPPILGCNVERPIAYFARKTLWKPGIASWWLDAVGAIPIDRDADSDLPAIKRVLAALRDGALVSFFPEGTRSPDGRLQRAKPGIGMVAAKARVPVVPCRIFDSRKALPREARLPRGLFPIHVVYGKPMAPSEYDPGDNAGRDRYQRVADRIMARIAALKKPRPLRV